MPIASSALAADSASATACAGFGPSSAAAWRIRRAVAACPSSHRRTAAFSCADTLVREGWRVRFSFIAISGWGRRSASCGQALLTCCFRSASSRFRVESSEASRAIAASRSFVTRGGADPEFVGEECRLVRLEILRCQHVQGIVDRTEGVVVPSESCQRPRLLLPQNASRFSGGTVSSSARGCRRHSSISDVTSSSLMTGPRG